MKRLLFFLFFLTAAFAAQGQEARWITSPETGVDEPNTWIAFRRDVVVNGTPRQAVARIAADTKYWLWVNGELAVFEGGLKRGPNPADTYYDEVDLAPWLKRGNNRIAVLLWHFGKDGYSHRNSGRAGLIFDLEAGRTSLHSDSTWLCRIHPAYGTAGDPPPNYRLAESNILFDARKDIPGWQTAEAGSPAGFRPAAEIGRWGDAPWNALVPRPIPQWKDFGIEEAEFEQHGDTVVARLPYNMQMTPILTLNDPAGGHLVKIATDHSVAGGTNNIRAEYVTRPGVQQYESLGWMNGERIVLTVPSGVEVAAVKYRETGYAAEPEGTFASSDEFYNRFWEKAERTLYVNMRDNYFDCPDRERAQWWGDVVLLMGESFYTWSTSAHALMRKAILELAAWQRPDGVLYSPIPGSYKNELPAQMLAGIGRYGFWNYYLNTGDRATIEQVYPAVKRYLALWQLDQTGLTAYRSGGWSWGDWGSNQDLRLILAGWHSIALEAAAEMATLLGMPEDAREYRRTMERIGEGYNRCWNGFAYRHPSYHGETDDRAQALAVLAGIAPAERYEALFEVLKTQEHASPYMEKYVMEALFEMGYGDYALERTRKRFGEMVDDPDHTTLYEGWGIGERGFGGGTTNHAWSGGAQTVIAQHLFGIAPLEAGYRTFLIEPDPASFASGAISVPTVSGTIRVSFENTGALTMQITVPEGTTAVVRLPGEDTLPVVDGIVVEDPEPGDSRWYKPGYTSLVFAPGDYTVGRPARSTPGLY